MQFTSEALRNHLAQAYGGKRAFFTTLWHASRASVGAFATYRRIDWQAVSRVVFVCRGNICRSAYAEHKFRASSGKAVSAGMEADPGQPADVCAQRVASHRGIDLGTHRSQAISKLPLCPGDLLVAFEPSQAKALGALVRDQKGVQVTLLGLWSTQPWWVYLHDPYGLSETYFERCFDRIEHGLTGILVRLDRSKGRQHIDDE
jgi:protein-tyrosine phosphatase